MEYTMWKVLRYQWSLVFDDFISIENQHMIRSKVSLQYSLYPIVCNIHGRIKWKLLITINNLNTYDNDKFQTHTYE